MKNQETKDRDHNVRAYNVTVADVYGFTLQENISNISWYMKTHKKQFWRHIIWYIRLTQQNLQVTVTQTRQATLSNKPRCYRVTII